MRCRGPVLQLILVVTLIVMHRGEVRPGENAATEITGRYTEDRPARLRFVQTYRAHRFFIVGDHQQKDHEPSNTAHKDDGQLSPWESGAGLVLATVRPGPLDLPDRTRFAPLAIGYRGPRLYFGPVRPGGIHRELYGPLTHRPGSPALTERSAPVLDGGLDPPSRTGASISLPGRSSFSVYRHPGKETVSSLDLRALDNSRTTLDLALLRSEAEPDAPGTDWWRSREYYPGGPVTHTAARLQADLGPFSPSVLVAASGGRYLRAGTLTRAAGSLELEFLQLRALAGWSDPQFRTPATDPTRTTRRTDLEAVLFPGGRVAPFAAFRTTRGTDPVYRGLAAVERRETEAGLPVRMGPTLFRLQGLQRIDTDDKGVESRTVRGELAAGIQYRVFQTELIATSQSRDGESELWRTRWQIVLGPPGLRLQAIHTAYHEIESSHRLNFRGEIRRGPVRISVAAADREDRPGAGPEIPDSIEEWRARYLWQSSIQFRIRW